MNIDLKENNLEWIRKLKDGDELFVKRVRNKTEVVYLSSKVVSATQYEIVLDTDFEIKLNNDDIEVIPTKYITEITDVFFFENNSEGIKLKKLDEIELKYPNLKVNVAISIPIAFVLMVFLSNILGSEITPKIIGIFAGQTIVTSFCLGYLYYFIKKMILNIKYNKIIKE